MNDGKKVGGYNFECQTRIELLSVDPNQRLFYNSHESFWLNYYDMWTGFQMQRKNQRFYVWGVRSDLWFAWKCPIIGGQTMLHKAAGLIVL